MGRVFSHPEGLLIWCNTEYADWEAEARRTFPWWYKLRSQGPEDLSEFAPDRSTEEMPRFLFKEANTGRVFGVVD